MKVENIVTLDRFYKEIIGHLVEIGVFILKIESVEKSTYRLPLLVLLCRKIDTSFRTHICPCGWLRAQDCLPTTFPRTTAPHCGNSAHF